MLFVVVVVDFDSWVYTPLYEFVFNFKDFHLWVPKCFFRPCEVALEYSHCVHL